MTKVGKYKGLAVMGLSVTAVGIFLLSTISITTPIYLMIAYLCVIGVGLGASMPVFSLTVQNAVSLRQLGVASASSQLFRSLGNTMGIGILGAIMSSRMASRMKEMFADGSMNEASAVPPDQAEQLGKLMNPEILMDQPKLEAIQSGLPTDLQGVAANMITSVKDVFSDALTTTFLAGAGIMVVAVIVAIFLREIPLVSAMDTKPMTSEKEGEPLH